MQALSIELNEEVIAMQVREEVQRLMPHYADFQTVQPVTIDLKKMSEITGISVSALRVHVLSDPRIQVHELHFMIGKRLWDYEGFRKTFLEIAKNNNFTKL